VDDQTLLTDSYSVASSPTVTELERNRAILRLRDRYANAALSLDEFSRAIDAALSATSREDLAGASPAASVAAPGSEAFWADASRLAEHLPPEEEILWIGRPQTRPRFAGQAVGRVPFLLLWFGFIIFWETTVIATGAPIIFPVFGAGMLLVGLSRLRGGFGFGGRRALYGVSTKRVVRVIEQRVGPRVDTALIRTIPNISVTPTKPGYGTVTFGTKSPAASPYGRRADPFSGYQLDDTVEFAGIPEASAVARLVGSLQSHDGT
jgi:hypothetical protein